MAELYEKYNKSNLFESKPVFNIEVEDLYLDKMKEVKSFPKLKIRDRSNTMTDNSCGDSKYKANFNGSNNYDKSRNSSFFNKFEGYDSGMKIPMINPLTNINRNYNKFDDSDFNSKLSEITLEENNYLHN